MKLVHTLSILATAAALAACGSTSAPKEKAGAASSAATAAAAPSTPTQAADGTLIGPKGMTLYTFAKDVAGSGASACNGTCAANWPPLPVAPAAQPLGDYTIITRADGTRQWAYKGMPLYYFAKDAQPGDKLGDGLLGGAWKVAKP
ncbi:ATP-binding protein [Comamonadaceae bacterium OH2545_COT-014]|nr:ATP-binding protein [Comamonadaceae bacterium OH2545_COT-014]